MAREDKLESLITGVLLISILFLTINFDLTIGIVFIGMIVFSIWRFLSGARITHNSTPNNSIKALLTAGIALTILLVLTLLISTVFQGLLNLSTQPTFQTILREGFAATGFDTVIPEAKQPIFRDSALLTIFTFGVVIAAIETRFLGRFMEWLAGLANVNLDGKFPSFKVIALFTLISGVFVFYHFNAKGVTQNVPLLITFIFSFISLEMIRRSKELESATYLHMINNLLFILPRV